MFSIVILSLVFFIVMLGVVMLSIVATLPYATTVSLQL